jgi:DNA helicase HerA-like ATPase
MILGSTGSGKTNLFLWLLYYQAFHAQPWVIFDYKRDEHIARIDRARQIGLNELPRYPGLYVVRPMPDTDDDNVLRWLRAAWARRNIGLGFDEAMMLPQTGGALQAIFIQGRSLKIPVLALSQRPVDLHRTMFSEASHVSVFQLNDGRDHKTVKQYIPNFNSEAVEKLPPHHSLWFRRSDKQTFHLNPVADWETLPDRINSRLPSRVYFI